MRMIIIRDDTDSRYDLYVCPPENLTLLQAMSAVDEAIRKIKGAHPEDFEFDMLESELVAAGFVWPMVDICDERW